MTLSLTPLRTGAFLLATLSTAIVADIQPAKADAKAFFGTLEGKFKGRGKAVPQGGTKPVSISCRVSNTYSAGSGQLKISGNCASTQGKAKVSGALKHNGNRVSGSFISPFADMRLTSSSGSYSGGKLDVVSNFVEKGSGKLQRMRQIVKKAGNGFRTDFYTFDSATKKYKAAGSIIFTKN